MRNWDNKGAIRILNAFRPTDHKDNSPQIQSNIAVVQVIGQKPPLKVAPGLICEKIKKNTTKHAAQKVVSSDKSRFKMV